jgi:hypothetical protein
VSQHDFIFSNEYRHRLTRHAAFVVVCWVIFLISFYVPIKVLPGWNTENFTVNVARIGLSRWLRLRLINSAFSFIPLLLFSYSVIYFLLPHYFFNKKNRGFTTIIFSGIFIGILLLQYFGGWLVAYNWVNANPTARTMPSSTSILEESISVIIFNYPIVAGFSVVIKMMKRGWLKQQETLLVAREKAKAELQLLKSQIHPHFLFNTLNNVYFLTLTESQKAPGMLIKLSDMLRYILHECDQALVPLEKEIKMIEDYMALEKIRYGNHLKMNLTIKGDYHNKMVAPLLLIPLVENSFKHGTSKMLEHPWVNLNISIEEQYLFFLLSNSTPHEITLAQHSGHIGLNNVKKRLELLYPGAHELEIKENKESFEIFVKICLEETNVAEIKPLTETITYALA